MSWSSAAALACETAERDAHLEQSCADPAVKAEITSLLILADDHYRRRLRQEARAAATLSHPAIATVYALEEFDGALYLVCEYVTGTTLREALQDGPLPTTTVRQAGTDIASALAAAHVRDLVHRNLKPENVMLTSEGSIHILDFGLAQFRHPPVGVGMSDTRLTQPGAIIAPPGIWLPSSSGGRTRTFEPTFSPSASRGTSSPREGIRSSATTR